MTPQTDRLNKVLAQLGLGSRRACDQLIAAGNVKVNDQPAKIGQQVGEHDQISYNGQLLRRDKPEPIVLAFHKPAGVTTTKKDPHAKITLAHFLPPEHQQLFPVGRLDRSSRGLLLLTNDGDLSYQLTHPKYAHEKEYEVKVTTTRPLRQEDFKRDLDRLTTEIIDPTVQTKSIKITNWDLSWHHNHPLGSVTIILEEGKKRQIRYLFRALGYTVLDLLRTRIANVRLENLKPGQYRKLEKEFLS